MGTTLREKVRVYEKLLHRLQSAQVGGNTELIKDLLERIWSWSYAHRAGNGELSEKEQRTLIERAFRRLED